MPADDFFCYQRALAMIQADNKNDRGCQGNAYHCNGHKTYKIVRNPQTDRIHDDERQAAHCHGRPNSADDIAFPCEVGHILFKNVETYDYISYTHYSEYLIRDHGRKSVDDQQLSGNASMKNVLPYRIVARSLPTA